ncbi:MAG: hypothetical protein HY534_01475 [Chloroflexi bacterium]|nr:hypothetical protein [Chloroflexota bacterium]
MLRKQADVSLVLIGFLVLAACAPTQAPQTGTGPEAGAPPQVFKTLKIAIQTEPITWDSVITGGSGSPTSGGQNNLAPIAQDAMRRTLTGGEVVDLLAAEVPDGAKGTWVVKPDGGMDMTWKLRSNVRWHDGTPLTSADVAFAVRLRTDPDSSRLAGGSGAERLLTGVTVLDDYTLVAHWSGVNVTVNDGTGLTPVAKHILDPVYQTSRQAVADSRYFTTEFVGTGPFKLVRWEPGSHIEFLRFDDYYRGPAKLNQVFLRFVPDPNTMVANIMSETVDVVLPQGVDVELAFELRERWQREGSGNQVLMETRDGIAQWEVMLNPTYARPVNGMTQQPVRQALLQAVDRPELVNVMTYGLSQIAYTIYHPDDENYPAVKDVVPPLNRQYEYPYDVRRAEQLLAQSGWTKGPDGVLVHQPSGERFNYQVLTRTGSDRFKESSIIQDYWKVIGVNLEIHVLTPAEAADNEYIATRSGASFNTAAGANFYGLRGHSSTIPRPETRWTGNNRGHFSSPVVDSLIEKIAVTIIQQERVALHRQLVAAITEPIPYHFWYYEIRPILMLKGVTGPRLVNQVSSGNIWAWDKN